jgi:hypothetical protein
MAMKFKKVHKVNLRNDAHFQFHTEFKDLLGKSQATEVSQLAPLWSKYQELYGIEDEGLKKIRKSHITQQIQDADKARDDLFTGMAEQNKSLLRHFEAAKREAAERLQIVFNTYGNVATKSLNEETSAIYNLLQDLRGDKYLAYTTAAGLLDWANELETRNAAFEALIKQRDTETSEKSDVNLKDARASLDAVYDEMTDIIEAHILLGTDSKAVLEAVITTFNPTIERYIKLLNARRKRPNPDSPDGDDGPDEESTGGSL